jgi:threonine dehydratase
MVGFACTNFVALVAPPGGRTPLSPWTSGASVRAPVGTLAVRVRHRPTWRGMGCWIPVNDLNRVRLQLDRVRDAVNAIDPVFLDTPALPCASLGHVLGCSVTLKVETVNPVRSFKGRGTETVAAVARRKGTSRMVCASAGNLGQALAYSGSRRDLDVTVVAARTANSLKVRQIAAFGADIRLEGEDIEDARLLARKMAEVDGAYLLEDGLDLASCEGAGTIGLELVRDDPRLDVVLVALGGGAMASGVGYAVRSLADAAVVIGIQPVGAPAMALSWRQGTVVETDRIETIADGVAGRCPIPEVLDDLLVVLDDVVLVREDSIKAGMRALYEHAGLVVEPSAALGIAAILEQPERFAGRRVTTILCGSNVGPADFARWVLEPDARVAR